VLEKQRKDAYCRGKVEDMEAQQALGFVLSTDGLLYKGDKLSEAKLVVPETLEMYGTRDTTADIETPHSDATEKDTTENLTQDPDCEPYHHSHP
jgi:hypothetical protein